MTAFFLLLGSLGFSLAFNMAWAWGGSFLSVAAAVACTLIVPAGLHLWPLIPAEHWFIKGVRALVMTGICSAAAITSFNHAVSVLMLQHWSDVSAASVTGGLECLVALSTMAVRTAAPTPAQTGQQTAVGQSAGQASGPSPGPVPDVSETVDEPVPDRSRQTVDRRSGQSKRTSQTGRRTLSVVDPDRADDFRKWAAELDEEPSTYAIKKRYGCGYDVAVRLLKELTDETEEATG